MAEQLGISFEPDDLNEIERRIKSLIKKGRENAVSVKSLMAITGLSNVKVRDTVRHLINEHNVLICSATTPPAGYYFPVSMEEKDSGTKQIESRIIELARRLRAMNRAAYERFYSQLRFEEMR
ncbi:MAG: hypothetical protein M1353_00620 [Nitrospirae bacterium]|nr:hypothetical protein [Nitrospirota bacterium]